jgi:hypothetical protein
MVQKVGYRTNMFLGFMHHEDRLQDWLRARLWCITKRQVRELLLAYHMDMPEAYLSPSSPYPPPGGVSGYSGGSGGDDGKGEEVIA